MSTAVLMQPITSHIVTMLKQRSTELRKGRYSHPGYVYMTTIVTHQRERHFAEWKIGRLVCHEMKQLHDLDEVNSLAWVIMPEHCHWLFQLRNIELARCMLKFKSRSALALNHHLQRSGRIWQPGYYERAMRSDDEVKQAARYIIDNPVRRGLVNKIHDYPLWDAVWV
ncbi:transposase [Pseudaeromonas sharmana]|uniref:Transposase n=1 Tax=Pseudaeromonas sharmana TaxID=328412 RepID=A0ABV8CS90_9GAMM